MSEMDCQELFLRCCLAKTTKSVYTKDCFSASAMKSVHTMNLDPNSLTRRKLRVGPATDTSDMSDQVKICPGASEMKSIHAMNRLDPNSLTHQKLRVVSATDTSEMNCVYADPDIIRECPAKTVNVYDCLASPATTIPTHTFCPANSSYVTGSLGGINTQFAYNTLPVNCTNMHT